MAGIVKRNAITGPMATFTVLGAGMMGAALCVPMADRGHTVRLVGTHLETEVVEALRRDRVHPRMGTELPVTIQVFGLEGLEKALDGSDVVALGVSSAGIGWACDTLKPHANPDVPIIMITKGMQWDGETLTPFPDVVQEALGGEVPTAGIAGPCIAGELARRIHSCVVLAGRDRPTLDRVSAWLSCGYYHVWTSEDVVGVEACAALKNAYAMAVAFGAGLHEQHGGSHGSVAMHNYESAVFAQSVVEMQRIVMALGGSPAAAVGLAGVGDLDVTTNGGRTSRFGRWLGKGLTLEQAIDKMEGATLECLEIIAVMRDATRAMRERGQLQEGDVPLLDHMAEVAIDGKPVDIPFARFFGGMA